MTRTLSDSLHPLDLRRIPRDLPTSEYKRGDEFKPFHPSASHVPPEYRDGWNHCWLAALAALAAGGEPQPVASPQVLTDGAARKQARDAVKRMHKARHFPSDTDACSRHVALMAETLATGQPYPMLDEEREHCAISLATTVAMLWEARAALSHQAGQKESGNV